MVVLAELTPQERLLVSHKSVLVEKEAYDRIFPEIKKAVAPLQQLRIMDRNLLSVWYFASDKARICISGLGPDEYLGGYKRIKQLEKQNASSEQIDEFLLSQVKSINERNI